MTPRVRRLSLAAAIALLIAGVVIDTSPPAHAATVNITVGPGGSAGYNPNGRTDTVTAGQTVQWTWATGSVPHTVTFDDGPSSGQMASGSYSRTFNAAGTFPYHCEVHASMTGTVVVHSTATTAATQPPPTSSPTTTKPKTTTPTTAATTKAPPGSTSTALAAATTTTLAAATAGASSSTSTSAPSSSSELAAASADHRRGKSHTGIWLLLIAILVVGGAAGLWMALRRSTGVSRHE